MAIRDELRDAHADLALQLATELGVQISFQASGAATALTLYALPVRNDTGLEEPGASRELNNAILDVPRQTGFPPDAGVHPQARVTYKGTAYLVQTVASDTLDAVYRLTLKRRKLNI